MLTTLLLALALAGGMAEPTPRAEVPAFAAHTYEARIRLKGKVSTTQVQATDAGHARKLIQAQYGPTVTVLSVKKVD